MKAFFFCILSSVCSLMWVQTNVYAKPLTINITKGVVESIPFVFVGLESGKEIEQVVANDLQNSGVFRLIPERGQQDPRQAFLNPEVWPFQVHQGAVLASGLVANDDGGLKATVRLYDVNTKKLLGECTIKSPSGQWRSLGHKISNAIYERLTGEKGYFDTKIVYTAQQGHPQSKVRRIAIMDYDGNNNRFLTSGQNPVFTPHASPKEPLVCFSAFHGYTMRIHIMNMDTESDSILPIKGIGISPRFSSDGQSLIFCLAHGGTTSVYSYDLKSRAVKRLTKTDGSIDVSPSLSPDGRHIIFTSNRQGSPKLYIADITASSTPRLLTSGSGLYFAPVWSPDGKWIAFVKQCAGSYYVGVIAADGTGERLLAKDHVIDKPSWAPNSRVLVFAAQQKRYGPFSLYLVNLSGDMVRKIPTGDYEGNHPCWVLQ